MAELATGAIAEAELLAAHALLHGESADARGVMAAAKANPHPAVARGVALPGCDRVAPGTWDLAICHEEAAIALWELSPPRMRWRRPIRARSVQMSIGPDGGPRVIALAGAAELVLLDAPAGGVEQRQEFAISTGFLDRITDAGDGDLLAATEGRIGSVFSMRARSVLYQERTCGTPPVAALAGSGGRIAVVCGDGGVRTWDPATRRMTELPIRSPLRPKSAALSRDGRTLLVGTVTGELARLDLSSLRAEPPRPLLDGPLNRVDFLGAEGVVVVAGESGGARAWDLASGAELLRLPVAVSATFRVDQRGLITGGRRAGRWILGASTPRALAVPVGLSAIAHSPDGRLLAAARGDGRVTVFDRGSGRVVREIPLGAGVVKTLDFSPDGRHLAASVAQHSTAPSLLRVDEWIARPLAPRDLSARRLLYDAGGDLIVLNFRPPLTVWSPTGERREFPGPEMYHAATAGRDVVLLSVDGGVFRLRDGALGAEGRDPGATLIAALPRSRLVVTGHDTGVSVRGRDSSRWLPNDEARLTDLAASPDERWIVAGRSDGTVAVWRAIDGRRVATLRGHRQRVAHVAFARDGKLATAGWDGRILTWDLSVLETPAPDLVARAEAAWAADLGLALRSPPR